MSKNVFIISSPDDMKDFGAVNLHRLLLRPKLVFTGIELRNPAHQYIIESPSGSSLCQLGDWAIIFPDGNLYKVTKSLFNKMLRELGGLVYSKIASEYMEKCEEKCAVPNATTYIQHL